MAEIEKFRPHLSKVKVPRGGDKVYKDECIFSFDSPESETGLYVCLNTFLGWGKEHVGKFSERTGNCIFLHLRRLKKLLPPEKDTEPEKKIAKLAIGIDGGFDPDAGKKKYEYEDRNSVVLLPGFDVISLPNPDLPEIILQSVSEIMKMESALHLAELDSASKAWDGEIRQVSKHADNLTQLDNGIKVPPSGWKCDMCDQVENLWMNLSDGHIFCGRRQFDGSGGNNHAVEHFSKTGYPLAVKLGTITPEGKADVFSYEEDDMVLNPNLTEHLAHFGINVAKMEKTDKTILELEIDCNRRVWEWYRLTEAGTTLQPKYGPGYTGIKNLGNSCYMNSVMQVLLTVPSFVERYYSPSNDIISDCSPISAPRDFNTQTSKLYHGLLSGRYSTEPAPSTSGSNQDIDDTQPGVSPLMFRTLVGDGHAEFSTKRQQDAMEYLQHFLKLVTRNSAGRSDPSECFKFEVEDKFVCSESGKVRYVTREDQCLPLLVPMEAATNKDEVAAYQARKTEAEANKLPLNEDQIHSKIPFDACLSKLAAPEEIPAYSSAVKKDVVMHKITRLTTFPDYLFIQLVKFHIGADWQPIKSDVSINMPEILDLSVLKGFGAQPGEELLPEEVVSPDPVVVPAIDNNVVQQLAEMGFPWEACRKSVQITGNSGSELALNWIMEHMGDPDFADPLPMPSSSGAQGSKAKIEPSENDLTMLMSMGFTKEQATLSLEETNNNLERAADWIFSHQHQLDSLLAARSGQSASTPSTSMSRPLFSDGEPKYELAAFVSHMGTSVHVGHYVCHIKKDGEWTIFNDNKVCKSANPPMDMGYIYLYKRVPS